MTVGEDMEERYIQFIKNIDYLKKAYGETNMDLALAIGIKSPNTFSNYRKLERFPEKEIREKIARHYRVTEEEMMYTDFSGLSFNMEQFSDKEKMNEIALMIYPVICSEEAMQDFIFKKAYSAHMRIVEAMKSGKAYSDEDADICIDSYNKIHETTEMPEAIANIIWWYMLTENLINNPNLNEGVKALNEKRISSKDFLKTYHLEDCSEDAELYNSDLDDDFDKEEVDEEIIELIKALKQSIIYAPLADYYIALRYITGCVHNELTYAMNKAFGAEMMFTLARLGNEYAKRFIQIGIKNR